MLRWRRKYTNNCICCLSSAPGVAEAVFWVLAQASCMAQLTGKTSYDILTCAALAANIVLNICSLAPFLAGYCFPFSLTDYRLGKPS